MFDVSKRAHLGLYALVELARAPYRSHARDELATQLGVSTHHLAKVMQSLARARLVVGTRGARGGYQLGIDPKAVSMADVIELLEGPTDLGPAPAPDDEIGGVLREINEQAYYTLKSITLHVLAHPPSR